MIQANAGTAVDSDNKAFRIKKIKKVEVKKNE